MKKINNFNYGLVTILGSFNSKVIKCIKSKTYYSNREENYLISHRYYD